MRHGIVKHYTRDGVTIVWRPGVCIHSRRCFHALPAVFDPSRRPWVDLGGADLDGSERSCSGATAFCRCGASGRKPFCDGSHRAAGFKD